MYVLREPFWMSYHTSLSALHVFCRAKSKAIIFPLVNYTFTAFSMASLPLLVSNSAAIRQYMVSPHKFIRAYHYKGYE